MRSPQRLLGIGGFALCLASCATWLSDPSQLSLQTVALIVLSTLGGLLAIRVPGLYPLPASLPLVGAMAVTTGAPAAVVAGFGAGLATALAPGDPDTPEETQGSRWSDAWTMGGALALGAGLAASGYSRIVLMAFSSAAPPAAAPAAPEEALRTALAILSAVLLCWLIIDALRQQRRRVMEAERRARAGLGLVESIALAIEAKDRTSERHLRRIRIYALEVGRRLGMRPADLEALEYASMLHDIGKLVVPESILSKPSGLSSEEFQVMSSHAKIGAEILETTSMPPAVVAMVRHHHERYDGSGYPDGLVGMEIPLGARILAAVDAFEALTSERPYRPGMTVSQTIAFLHRQSGIYFDPRVVRILIQHHAEFEQLVVAEEKTRAGQGREREPGARRPRAVNKAETAATGADTRKIRPLFQTVLDRIASSHMEIYSLHEISQALGKSMNLDESFMLIAGKLQRLIHFSTCVIYVFDPEKELLLPRFATGAGASRFYSLSMPLGERISGWAALQRRPAMNAHAAATGEPPHEQSDIAEIADDPEVAPLTSCLAAPLLVDESLVGVITLYDDAEHEFGTPEEHLLALVGRHVALAVRTGLLFEQSQEHALTDSLTGLPNSRYMFIAFDQEVARAKEHSTPLTLMVLDIDRFREINDDFGHHAGDRFLVGMAKAIRSQLRICDTCVRYAGDEFVALMPGLEGREVDVVMERMTDAARDYCMEARPGRPVHLSLSIGHATMPADGDDFESLIAVADARMREQKARHRESERGADPLDLDEFGPLSQQGRN